MSTFQPGQRVMVTVIHEHEARLNGPATVLGETGPGSGLWRVWPDHGRRPEHSIVDYLVVDETELSALPDETAPSSGREAPEPAPADTPAPLGATVTVRADKVRVGDRLPAGQFFEDFVVTGVQRSSISDDLRLWLSDDEQVAETCSPALAPDTPVVIRPRKES